MNQGTQIAFVGTFAYRSGADAMELQFAVPLGIDLAAGATMMIGNDFSVPIPVTRCTQQGCLVEGTLGKVLLQRLLAAEQAGGSASVTVVNPGQGPFTVPISLQGFAAAHESIAPSTVRTSLREASEAQAAGVPDANAQSDAAPAAQTRSGDGTEADRDGPVTGADTSDPPLLESGPVRIVPPDPQPQDNRLAPVTGNEPPPTPAVPVTPETITNSQAGPSSTRRRP